MKKADEIQQARTKILAAYRECFTGEAGRLVLADLERSTGYGRPSFMRPPEGHPYDPLAAAIRDGRKSVVDEIHDRLRTAADEPVKGPGVRG
ncbi:hypothetical protein [Luteolibacter sp. LG18]|uniref:Bbp19 family protein n=1 Tax=Luteolibacter sp. LG18 TaxID=2819286 RepID=UPI0030C6E6C7